MSDWHKKWKTELIIFKAGTSKNADLVVETDREITRLEAENAALREQIAKLCALYDKHANPSRWIGVEERLPEAGERVLVWFDHYTSPAVATWFLGEGFFADYPDGTAEHDTVEICYLTHWMPLPEPPEATDE